MKKLTLLACAASFAALPLSAQEEKKVFPAPGEIVAAGKAEEWVAIAPSDLLVMDLADLPDGKVLKPRRVVIQLIPAPFSQGWVGNIRKLATAQWWDGTAIVRVQDNYVTQWGDPNGEDKAKAKPLPPGLETVPESGYVVDEPSGFAPAGLPLFYQANVSAPSPTLWKGRIVFRDNPSANYGGFHRGFPYAGAMNPHQSKIWPIHCYAMVGVGRNLSPDTGSGAELYTVIGHAPRHLDRNIALVGRVIEGIEHLTSLPRGTGALGFYETEAERVPIRSVRLGNGVAGLPAFEYLSTDSKSFAAYADARANRRDPFFNVPAGGADICNIPVPVRGKAK